jgi:CRP-like cAMP-binding protein
VTRPDELLRQHPLFVRLSPEQIDRFARVGELESFHADEQIVVEGTLGDALYLILSGKVEVVKNGHRLAILQAGAFFGEMSLVEPAARSATVVAMEAAHLFRLPNFGVQGLLVEDAVAFNHVLVTIVRVLSERLRHANQQMGDVGLLADWLAGSLV